MAFWNNSTNTIYIKLLWLKAEQPKHYFEVNEKDWDDWKKTEAEFISWQLTKIEEWSYEYEGNIVNLIKFHIEDWDDKMIWSTSWTNLARWFINSLLNVEWEVWNLKLSLYINDKKYKSMWIEHNWKPIGWKYTYEEQKDKTEIITNKKWDFVKTDYDWLNEFLLEELKKIKFKENIIEEVKSKSDKDEPIDESLPF